MMFIPCSREQVPKALGIGGDGKTFLEKASPALSKLPERLAPHPPSPKAFAPTESLSAVFLKIEEKTPSYHFIA